MLYCVVTTIQPPTPSTHKLAEAISNCRGCLVVVGDRKGPAAYDFSRQNVLSADRLTFLDLNAQLQGEFELAKLLPENHYARKNIGYLRAVYMGATCIYETDDDNAPLPNWKVRLSRVKAMGGPPARWLNAYRHFSAERIWPRGFPLDELASPDKDDSSAARSMHEITAPIQQGLANGSPDVDAVWRLVLDRPFVFEDKPSLHLSPGSWCPFNSQSTWWWPEAYALMYLPSHCSFRMTDIWRSFIAQRCLWELGYGVVFHPAEVYQERNEHDLMRDFADEVVGYLRNREMVDILANLPLRAGKGHQASNLRLCYQTLVANGFFPEIELVLVEAWLRDLDQMIDG